jgi:hypothetical protein
MARDGRGLIAAASRPSAPGRDGREMTARHDRPSSDAQIRAGVARYHLGATSNTPARSTHPGGWIGTSPPRFARPGPTLGARPPTFLASSGRRARWRSGDYSPALRVALTPSIPASARSVDIAREGRRVSRRSAPVSPSRWAGCSSASSRARSPAASARSEAASARSSAARDLSAAASARSSSSSRISCASRSLEGRVRSDACASRPRPPSSRISAIRSRSVAAWSRSRAVDRRRSRFTWRSSDDLARSSRELSYAFCSAGVRLRYTARSLSAIAWSSSDARWSRSALI